MAVCSNDKLLSGSMWASLRVSITSDDEQFEQQFRLKQESDRESSMRTGDQLGARSGGIIAGTRGSIPDEIESPMTTR
jgi:hypothetical protein